MADEAEKARQEKIAAAKKRVEQMKKKSKKGGASKKSKDDTADAPAAETDDAAPEQPEPVDEKVVEQTAEDEKPDEATEPSPSATPSLAAQSKMRSTSFRAGITSGTTPVSPGPFSPEGDTAPDIYRKHVARIEELEADIKRLTKESADSEKRWKKAEEELADLREADGNATVAVDAGEVEKLRSEIASLERQNTQLQQQISRGSSHRQSVSVASPPPHLQAQLDSKSATIEQMEIEISKLRIQADRRESGASVEKDQVTALEEKLARAEAAAGKAQRELQDVKKNLERTSEKAVREGSERSSAETKVKTLEHELETAQAAEQEATRKVDGLEKKITTLTTLHKEQDARLQALRKDKEKAEKEVQELKARIEKLEDENVKLRSRKSTEGGGLDDEGVDELEDEERARLQKKIRSLETENHELRSGAWIQKRRDMEATSPGFQDVDLSGGATGPASARRPHATGGISDFFTSGLNALAGGNNDEFLEEEEDMDFDEDAFRKAHEEEAKNRLERIKEIKRSLKHWEGWRLDIVDIRRGSGEGIGPVFDI